MRLVRRRAALLLSGSLALAAAALPGSPASAAPVAKLPKITAAAWLVADLNTGQIVAARSAHRPLAPASTLKALTLLALSPTVRVDDASTSYVAQDSDAAIDGSKVGLVPTSRYRPVDLYHGMLLGSGNDCAHALAELAGGQAEAVRLMSAEALRLGAVDTTVRNTSGLDATAQVSTAYDLALFGRAVLAQPKLAKLVRTTSYTFPSAGKNFSPKRKHFQIQNHNRLLRNYDGALGVKNGYTVAAGGSFIGAARRGDHAYLVTVLKAKGSTWHLTRDLLDWAFANGDAVAAGAGAAALGTLVEPDDVDPATGLPRANDTNTNGTDGVTGQGEDGAGTSGAGGTGGQNDAVQALAVTTSGAAGGTGPGERVLWFAATLGALAVVAAGLHGFGRRRVERLPGHHPRHSA